MKEANKEEPYIKRKPLKGQINRQVKFSNKSLEVLVSPTDLKSIKSKSRENESILNVSLIEGCSFLSNKHDGSLDSMDKMIIGGVAGMEIDEKEFEEDEDRLEPSKSSLNDLDFTEIHKQYEKLIGRNELLGEEELEENSDDLEETSQVLPDEDDWQLKEPCQIYKRSSLQHSPKKEEYCQNEIKLHLQKIQIKVDEIKSKKIQGDSNSSIKILVGNVGNLSEIHEEKENLLNISLDVERKRINEEDEQDIIDFVSQPDPYKNSEKNTKKNENENNFNDEEGDWEIPNFANLEEDEDKYKEMKKEEKNSNYQQILEALNSKEEDETLSELQEIFSKREEWIKSQKHRPEKWKESELNLITKMKNIIKNPHYDSFDNE